MSARLSETERARIEALRSEGVRCDPQIRLPERARSARSAQRHSRRQRHLIIGGQLRCIRRRRSRAVIRGGGRTGHR